MIIGGDPDELIVGNTGNDELYGGRGRDVVVGGEGNDFLSGNQGDDILVGGTGADTFCFDGDYDSETVADFSVQDGDHLRFIFYTPAQADLSSAELLELFVQVGDDAVLTLPDTDERVVLHGVDVDDLTEDMITVTIIPPVCEMFW